MCGDGRCVEFIGMCGSKGNCPMHRPFTCGMNICVANPMDCSARISSGAFNKKVVEFEGNDLADNEEDSIHVFNFRNNINFQSSLVLRYSYNVFFPNPVSPYYDMSLIAEAKMNDTPKKKRLNK